MGVGKSTIGNILSKKLEMLFVDLDHEIEKSIGSQIPEIFQCSHLQKLQNSRISGVAMHKHRSHFGSRSQSLGPAQRARHRKVDVDKGSPPIIFFTLDDEAPLRSWRALAPRTRAAQTSISIRVSDSRLLKQAGQRGSVLLFCPILRTHIRKFNTKYNFRNIHPHPLQ